MVGSEVVRVVLKGAQYVVFNFWLSSYLRPFKLWPIYCVRNKHPNMESYDASAGEHVGFNLRINEALVQLIPSQTPGQPLPDLISGSTAGLCMPFSLLHPPYLENFDKLV